MEDLGESSTSASWRRSLAPRVLISLVAAWLAAFVLRPPVYHVIQLSRLGQEVKVGNKYGLSPEKLAIVFEPRAVPHLAAHLLHTIGVLPSDWPLLYVGSYASISSVNASYGIQMAQLKGRLWMQEAPDWVDFEDEDQLASVIAMPEFYNALPSSVEWLFMSGTDSIICSSSLITMDDWSHYDWVGSPWSTNSWHGGGNGFSMRRVSKVKRAMKALRGKKDLYDDTHIMEAIYTHPKAVVPSESTSALFVMEILWAERPMAYHPSPIFLKEDEGWVRENARRGIWDHCPELKTIMEMKLAREKCPDQPKPAALAAPLVPLEIEDPNGPISMHTPPKLPPPPDLANLLPAG